MTLLEYKSRLYKNNIDVSFVMRGLNPNIYEGYTEGRYEFMGQFEKDLMNLKNFIGTSIQVDAYIELNLDKQSYFQFQNNPNQEFIVRYYFEEMNKKIKL